MNKKIEIIFNGNHITESTFSNLWEFLSSFPITITKYDFHEPIKKEFIPTKEQGLKNYKKYSGGIYFKGEGSKFWGVIQKRSTGFSRLSFEIEKAIDILSIADWLKKLNNLIPIVYCNITTELEKDFKHKTTEIYEDGGGATGWPGLSYRNFQEYMPGIYWFNAFGKEFIEAVGKDRFSNLPNCTIVDLEADMMAFHLNSPLETKDMEARLKEEQLIADAIGKEYFYDKYRPELNFSHPPKFIEYVNEVEDEYYKMLDELDN